MSRMFEDRIRDEYFDWLYDYVCKGRVHNKISYIKLFNCLHNIEFVYHMRSDADRAEDGISLRYRFAINTGDDDLVQRDIMFALDGPCSVLEMMVALSIRCEENIMDNTNYGDRTGQWFWGMISNLGIGPMHDDIYDEEIVIRHINIFLDREYEPNGKGGLFYIRDCIDDLRDVEIWVQLCWYLDNFS